LLLWWQSLGSSWLPPAPFAARLISCREDALEALVHLVSKRQAIMQAEVMVIITSSQQTITQAEARDLLLIMQGKAGVQMQAITVVLPGTK
jgi:hypothetical protein